MSSNCSKFCLKTNLDVCLSEHEYQNIFVKGKTNYLKLQLNNKKKSCPTKINYFIKVLHPTIVFFLVYNMAWVWLILKEHMFSLGSTHPSPYIYTMVVVF